MTQLALTSLPLRFHRIVCVIGLGLAVLVSSAVAASHQVSSPPVAQRAPSGSRGASSTPTVDSEPSRFRITGTVINAITKVPVPKAQLSVSPMGGRRTTGRFGQRSFGQTIDTVADASGHFELQLPSAGGWSVNASARGYRSQAFDEHDGFSTAIILTEANPTFELTFPLTPGSVIEGFVLDEAGEAVRNGQLTLSRIPPATPDEPHPRPQVRSSQRTDDRGYYKFSGLVAGEYTISVQAHPWYATTASRSNRLLGTAAATGEANEPAPDPLDVVYPTVWYPGVTEYSAATPITVHGGETHEADFRLLPMPGFHLRIKSDPPPAADEGKGTPRATQSGAYITRVMPDGSETGVPIPMSLDSQGNVEFSGLAPGTYVVHRQAESTNLQSSTTVQIDPGSARYVDLSQGEPAIQVTVKIDAAAETNALQISFRDLQSGRVSYAQRPQDFRFLRGRGGVRNVDPESGGKSATASDRVVELQPGRYSVSLSGISDLHLASIEPTGAKATGRIVTITSGSPTLLLHVTSGRINLTGFVRFHGSPDPGAMVLLVPASLGDPSGLEITRRDQSNSDGSFDLTGVLPGAYILVAIDHGWEVNWADPSTLRRYLMQGLPLDLTSPGNRKETIEAQSP